MAIKIYIDQGHNPQNPNAGAEGNGLREQDIVFSVGTELASLLRQNGNYEVRLSRPTADTVIGTTNTTSLRQRVADANTWGADYFISLHTNASSNPQATGSEAFAFSQPSAAFSLGEDTLVYIPSAMEPCFPDLGRQLLQGSHVLRLALHQCQVICDQCLYEGIVFRMLILSESSVNEYSFEVSMARPTWVEGIYRALGEVVGTTHTGINGGQPVLQELSCLISEPDIILSTLVLAQVTIIGAVAKPYGGSIGEGEALITLVVLGYSIEQCQQRCNVVVQQLSVGLSGDQDLDAGKVQAQQNSLPSHEPTLATASGPSIGKVSLTSLECLGLLLIGLGHHQFLTGHSLSDSLPE